MDNLQNGLLEKSVIHQDQNGTALEITQDGIAAESVRRIYKLLWKIGKSKQQPFSILFSGKKIIHNTCGDELLEVIRRLKDIPPLHLKDRVLHPLIVTFQTSLQKHDFTSRIYNGKLIPTDLKSTASMLNNLADEYRSALNSDTYKQHLGKYQRASRKNLTGATAYVNHLYSRYARLLVVRLDVSWTKQYAKDITAEMAKVNRQQLFRNMKRNALFRHVLGVMWKLEYGVEKGFHYHMIFFLDGNKAHSGVTISRQFGEYWKNIITENKGVFFNCNADITRYEQSGIGMVKHNDESMREGLVKAVTYLTKVDAYARLSLPGNVRTFGRGEIKSFKIRGRKRTNNQDQED